MLSWFKRKLSGTESLSVDVDDDDDYVTDQDVTTLSDAALYIQQIFEKGLDKSPENVFSKSIHPSPTDQHRKISSEKEFVSISPNKFQKEKNSIKSYQVDDYNYQTFVGNQSFSIHQGFDTIDNENIVLPVQGSHIQLQYPLLEKYNGNLVEKKSTEDELVKPSSNSNSISLQTKKENKENFPPQTEQARVDYSCSNTFMCGFSDKKVEESLKSISNNEHANVYIPLHNLTTVAVNGISENSNLRMNNAPQLYDNSSQPEDISIRNIVAETVYVPQVSPIKKRKSKYDKSKLSQNKESLKTIKSKSHEEMSNFSDIILKMEKNSINKDILSVPQTENSLDLKITAMDKDELSRSGNNLKFPQNITNEDSKINSTNSYIDIEQRNNIISPECATNCHGTLIPVFDIPVYEVHRRTKAVNLILSATVHEKEENIFVSQKRVYVKNGVLHKCNNIKKELEVQFDGHVLNGSYHATVIWIGEKPGCLARDRKTIEYYDIPAKYYGIVPGRHHVMAVIDGTIIPISAANGTLFQLLYNTLGERIKEKLDLHQLLNIHVRYDPKNVHYKWNIILAVLASNEEHANCSVNWPVDFIDPSSQELQIVDKENSGHNICLHPLAITKESDICVRLKYDSSTKFSVLAGLPNCLLNWNGTLIENFDVKDVKGSRKFMILAKISQQNHDILIPKKGFYFENGNEKSVSNIKKNMPIQFDAILYGDGYRMLVMWVGAKPTKSVVENGDIYYYDVPGKYYGCYDKDIHLLLAAIEGEFIPISYKLQIFNAMGENIKPAINSCLSLHLRQYLIRGSSNWSITLPICLQSVIECSPEIPFWPDLSMVSEIFDQVCLSVQSKSENSTQKFWSYSTKNEIPIDISVSSNNCSDNTAVKEKAITSSTSIPKETQNQEVNNIYQEDIHSENLQKEIISYDILAIKLKEYINEYHNSDILPSCLVNLQGVIRKNHVLNGKKTSGIIIQTNALGKSLMIMISKKRSYCENEVFKPCASLVQLSNISFDAYLSGNRYCISVMWVGDRPRKVENNGESYYYSVPSRYVGKSEKGHHLLSLIDEIYVPVTLRSSWSFFSFTGGKVTPTVGCTVYLHMKKTEANQKIKWTAFFSVAESEKIDNEFSNMPLDETDDSNIYQNQGKEDNDTGKAYELPKCLVNWHGTISAKFKNKKKNCIENYVITTKIAENDYEIFVPKEELYFENGVLKSNQCLIATNSIEFDAYYKPDGYCVSVMWSGDKPKYMCMEDGEIRYFDILCKYYGWNGNMHQLIAVINGYLIPIELKQSLKVFKVNGKEVEPNAVDFILSHLKRNERNELVTWSVLFPSVRPSEKGYFGMFWPILFNDFKIMHLLANKVLMHDNLSDVMKKKLCTHIDKIQLPEVLQNCVGTLIPIFCKDNPDILEYCVLKTNIKGGTYVTHIHNTYGQYIDNEILRNFSHMKSRIEVRFDAHLTDGGDGYAKNLIWVGKKPNQVGKFYSDVPLKNYGFNEEHQILAYVKGKYIPIKVDSFNVSNCYSNSSDEMIASPVTENSPLSAFLRKKQGNWKLLYCVPYNDDNKCSQESISWPQTFLISDGSTSDKNNNVILYTSEEKVIDQAIKCHKSNTTLCDTDKGLSKNANLPEPDSLKSSVDCSSTNNLDLNEDPMTQASSNKSLKYNGCSKKVSNNDPCGSNEIKYGYLNKPYTTYFGRWERLSNMELYVNPDMISNAKNFQIVYKSGSFLKFNGTMGFMKTSVNKNIVFYRENFYINRVKLSLTIQNSSVKVGNMVHGQCYELKKPVVIDELPISYVCIIAYSGKMHQNVAILIQKWKDNVQKTVKDTSSSKSLDSMDCSDTNRAHLNSSKSRNYLSAKNEDSVGDKKNVAKSNSSSTNENFNEDRKDMADIKTTPLLSSKSRNDSSSTKDSIGDKKNIAYSTITLLISSKSSNDSSSTKEDSIGEKRNMANSKTLLENSKCKKESSPSNFCNSSKIENTHLNNSSSTYYGGWVRLFSNMDLYANLEMVSKAKNSQIITKFGSFVKFNGSLGFMRTILNENIVFHRENLYIKRVKFSHPLQNSLMKTGINMICPCFELENAVVIDGIPVNFVCIFAYSGEMHSNICNLIEKWKDGVKMTLPSNSTSKLFSPEIDQLQPLNRTPNRIEFGNRQTK